MGHICNTKGWIRGGEGREGERERGREEGREGGRERGKKEGREGGREGGREDRIEGERGEREMNM